jgi:hypothetical protein
MHIRERSVEVLTLIYWAIIIILTIHYLEVTLESLLDLLNYIAFGCIWVHWLSSLPVVFIPLIKETMVADAIAGHLINILHLIRILMCSATFIKEFLILRVIECIVLRVCHIGSIIPCRNGT